MLILYRIKHKETGLYFKASKHRSPSNLSPTGKVYVRKPSLKNAAGRYRHPADQPDKWASASRWPTRPSTIEDWEVEVLHAVAQD